MAVGGEQFEVFLSYRSDRNSADKVSAPLAMDIKRVLQDSLAISTFVDQQFIVIGNDYLSRIKDHVSRSKIVICILSREFFESDFCRFEFSEAKIQRKLLAFASSADFNPGDYPHFWNEGRSIPKLSSWDRTLKDAVFRRLLEPIARMIGRPALVELADALALNDDERVLRWCAQNPDDPAARKHQARLAGRVKSKLSKGRPTFFISHSTVDKSKADQLVAVLESKGISCWITPRDVPAGDHYAAAIAEAITNITDATIVLVSPNSQESAAVLRELDIATLSKKRILPVIIDRYNPAGGLLYYTASVQRLRFEDLNTTLVSSLEKLSNAT